MTFRRRAASRDRISARHRRASLSIERAEPGSTALSFAPSAHAQSIIRNLIDAACAASGCRRASRNPTAASRRRRSTFPPNMRAVSPRSTSKKDPSATEGQTVGKSPRPNWKRNCARRRPPRKRRATRRRWRKPTSPQQTERSTISPNPSTNAAQNCQNRERSASRPTISANTIMTSTDRFSASRQAATTQPIRRGSQIKSPDAEVERIKAMLVLT